MSRWQQLIRTSPSGKTLFFCIVCGRTSIAPDKECPKVAENASCAEVEREWTNTVHIDVTRRGRLITNNGSVAICVFTKNIGASIIPGETYSLPAGHKGPIRISWEEP